MSAQTFLPNDFVKSKLDPFLVGLVICKGRIAGGRIAGYRILLANGDETFLETDDMRLISRLREDR